MHYTNQDAFDIVYRHFILDEKPYGVNRMGHCALRGIDGRKCAVGLLIDDGDYDSRVEDFDLTKLPWADWCTTFDDIEFIGALQWEHDALTGRKLYAKRMQNLAKEYSLTVPE